MARRRRRTVRLTPLGYIVLSIIILVILVGIYFIIWSMRGDKSGSAQNMASNSVSITPTPSLPPAGTPAPTAPPTEAPTTPPTAPPETPIPTPKQDDTPEPDVKTPSPAQVQSALDGKLITKLNLRRGPGKQYSIVGTYSTGTRLKIYARENDFYFVMVVKENKYGYMAVEYVEKDGLLPGESATPTPSAPDGAVAGKVSASSLALRSGPSKDSKSVGELKRGDAVYVYFKTGDFYYIQVLETGLKCYAFASYVQAESAVPTGTPVP